MNPKIALLFAGQGAQTVGMGRDLAEQFPTAADLFQQADDVLGRKLSEIAWQGPIEELTKTSNCQPALFVHGLACLSILRDLAGGFPRGGRISFAFDRKRLPNAWRGAAPGPGAAAAFSCACQCDRR